MIETRRPGWGRLAASLDAKARALAAGRAQRRRARATGDGRHWRDARLLWPLFARKD